MFVFRGFTQRCHLLLLHCCQLLRHCWNRGMGELWPKGAWGGVHFFIVTAAPPILWLSALPLGIRLLGHASNRHSQHDHQYPTPAVCNHQPPPHPKGQAQEGFQDITKSDLLCMRMCASLFGGRVCSDPLHLLM